MTLLKFRKKTTKTLQVDLSKSLKFDSPALFFRYVNVVLYIYIYKHNNHNNTHDSWSVSQHMFHLWPPIEQSATSSCNDFSSWLVCKTSQLGLERARQVLLDEPQTSCFRPQFTTMKYHILQNKRYENPLCKLSKINKPGFFRGLWTFNECDNGRTEGKKMICLGMKRNSKWSRTRLVAGDEL